MAQNRHVLLPVCFGAFERNARSHWNAAVGGLTVKVEDADGDGSAALRGVPKKLGEEEELRSQETEENRKQRWKQVEALAAKSIAS